MSDSNKPQPSVNSSALPTSGQPVVRRQQRGAAATRSIVRAAYELLMRDGYAAFTIDGVAEHAGMSKATIYRRWPNKQALVADVARNGLQDLRIPDLGSFREEIRYYLMARLEWFASDEITWSVAGLLSAVAEDASLEAGVVAQTQHLLKSVHAVVERGKARGEVRQDVDTDLMGHVVAAPLVFLKIFSRRNPDVDFVNSVVDLLCRAVAPGSPLPEGAEGSTP